MHNRNLGYNVSRNSFLLGLIALVISLTVLSCDLGLPVTQNTQAVTPATGAQDSTALSQVAQAIHDNEYYLAAAILRNTLSGQPTQPQSQSYLQQIAAHVPGGLITDGNPGTYYPFARAETVPMPHWPQDANHLVAASVDGQRGIFTKMYNNVETFIVDFASGTMVHYDQLEPIPSPNLDLTIRQDFSKDARVYDFRSQQETKLCAPYNSGFYWTRDSRTVVGVDGNTQTVYIIDTQSGTCPSAHIAGVVWDVEVFTSPDAQNLWIITPGSFSSQTKGQLLTAKPDGTGIKKVADLPFKGRKSKRSLIAPDGSAIYVEGYLVSTRSGMAIPSASNAVAWVERDPPFAAPAQIKLTSSPSEGQRGTRFTFRLQGGPAGQEISWAVNTKPGQPYNSYPVASGKALLDQTGSLSDTNKQFGWSTDINTNATAYYLTVYINTRPIAEIPLKVTEP